MKKKLRFRKDIKPSERLKELRERLDFAYAPAQSFAERARDDMIFCWVDQWRDSWLDDAPLDIRLEFNILRKGIRQVIEDIEQHPINIEFDHIGDGDRGDDIDFLTGLYLTDENLNSSIEARSAAIKEAVAVGFGAWELYTEEIDGLIVVRRRPIQEAHSRVFYDPDAIRVDKSDATFCAVVDSYTGEGYKRIFKEITGEEPDRLPSDVVGLCDSYGFDWTPEEHQIITLYEQEECMEQVVVLVDPDGGEIEVPAQKMEEVRGDIDSFGLIVAREETRQRKIVTRTLFSGTDVIEDKTCIHGEHIPVIPMYGETQRIGGIEYKEGVVRLAKDPQILHNFMVSHLAKITAQSPTGRPIYVPQQIAGYEDMYQDDGQARYPYLLQNLRDDDGAELPFGPVATEEPAQVPPALGQLLEITRQGVADVANPGQVKDMQDIDLSGAAIGKIDDRISQQSMVYRRAYKHAMRRDAEVWASIMIEVFDSQRSVVITDETGARHKAQAYEVVMDGDGFSVKNSLEGLKPSVFASIGEQYHTKKEKTIESLERIATTYGEIDPTLRKAIIMKIVAMMDGGDMRDLRDYASRELLMMGIREPATDEERAMLEQVSQQPDPVMMQAEGIRMEGEAALIEAQTKQAKMQADVQAQQTDGAVKVFEAQTRRMKTQVDAQKAGAEINFKRMQALERNVPDAASLRQRSLMR